MCSGLESPPLYTFPEMHLSRNAPFQKVNGPPPLSFMDVILGVFDLSKEENVKFTDCLDTFCKTCPWSLPVLTQSKPGLDPSVVEYYVW
jgi:hypothetical protein